MGDNDVLHVRLSPPTPVVRVGKKKLNGIKLYSNVMINIIIIRIRIKLIRVRSTETLYEAVKNKKIIHFTNNTTHTRNKNTILITRYPLFSAFAQHSVADDVCV